MTAAATATTSTNYQLTTTGNEPEKQTKVDLPNGLTLMFYSQNTPLMLYVQQHKFSDPIIFNSLYETIPCMPVDLLRLIVQYLPILTDLSHYPALTAGMQSLYPISPEI